jgi:sugar phosphate isomerase/epimerase
MREDQIALQLYTVRKPAADDLRATLRQVAEAGFRSVELAGLPELSAEAVKGELDRAGLRAIAAHRSIDDLRSDLDRCLTELGILGCPRVIVPWLPDADRSSPDRVRAVAAELGRMADTCARHSIAVGYHNHAFEFAPLDGRSIWEVLVSALPESVDLELDVYWATIGNQDPVALIDRLGRRVRLLHMKDVAADTERRDAPAGEGTLPWPAIVEAGRQAGVEWYVVEQDEPADPVGDSTRARRYLAGLAVESASDRSAGSPPPRSGPGRVG